MSSIYDCEVCNDKDDTIRDLREQCAELERENEELACALRDERMEVARLGGCILGVCHMNEQARAQRDEYRKQCRRWEKAWDALLRLSAVDPLFDIAVTTYIKRYDPRNKEKG